MPGFILITVKGPGSIFQTESKIPKGNVSSIRVFRHDLAQEHFFEENYILEISKIFCADFNSCRKRIKIPR